jgi:tripartite-type tricarboxylate transporter receptor subunit TctC
MDALQTKLTTVQYRGGGPALVDVMTGRIHLWCDPATGPIPYVLDGKMKALAITTKSRLPTLPGVPTADEAGLPDSRYPLGMASTPRAARRFPWLRRSIRRCSRPSKIR